MIGTIILPMCLWLSDNTIPDPTAAAARRRRTTVAVRFRARANAPRSRRAERPPARPIERRADSAVRGEEWVLKESEEEWKRDNDSVVERESARREERGQREQRTEDGELRGTETKQGE